MAPLQLEPTTFSLLINPAPQRYRQHTQPSRLWIGGSDVPLCQPETPLKACRASPRLLAGNRERVYQPISVIGAHSACAGVETSDSRSSARLEAVSHARLFRSRSKGWIASCRDRRCCGCAVDRCDNKEKTAFLIECKMSIAPKAA